MSDDMSMGLPSSAGEHGVLRSMQEVAMSSQEASKMLRTYNIAWWGNNYYDVNELGHISVCPDPDVPEALPIPDHRNSFSSCRELYHPFCPGYKRNFHTFRPDP